MIWKMAWRNLWRHRGRTLIMTSAVALAYGLMLLGMGINDDGHARMLREAARAAGGDVLVHGEGYWETRGADIVVPDGETTLARLRALPGVEEAYPRVLVMGLASTSVDNRPLMLQGIRPAVEARLSDHAEDLVEGTFLEGDRAAPLVLGSRVARRLEVGPGDRVVLTATGADGEMTRALFHLTGIIETGTRQLDEIAGFTTLEAAQRALGMGDAVTQIGLDLAEDADPDAVAVQARAALPGGGAGYEVLTWAEAVPEMVGLVELDDAFGFIYMGVIFAVVLFSITNTFLMAVMERVREFGLLNALGLRHGGIGRLMLAETLLMTALAMSVGFLLGFAGHLAVQHWGIAVASYGIEEMEMAGIDLSDMVIYSTINPLKWAAGSVLVAVATIISALYPAWRATRLAPAEAMRFFE